ncbi:hypothetical protein CPB83DRAFT_925422 [Crepidotus variabilis]|uniref:Uncharacterized protein n=1 Tax=Crepidotus variabilis TaxID=179855 RepID=A0A9P6EJD2_9AGAR|nr:hypothetical protein CPB83DRAFT_925422 [Crepidotus variabilis]
MRSTFESYIRRVKSEDTSWCWCRWKRGREMAEEWCWCWMIIEDHRRSLKMERRKRRRKEEREGEGEAEVWIKRCAKLLHRLSKTHGEGVSQNDMADEKHWKGAKGFSVERWNFWKEILDVITVSEQASKRTRLTARDLKAIMIAAEEDDPLKSS